MGDYDLFVHWVVIKVKPKQGLDTILILRWDNLTKEIRMKYDWYFKYRAALIQVKYPKYYISFDWGHDMAVGKTLKQLKEKKIVAKKSTITKTKNKIAVYQLEFENYKNTYLRIFPIEEEIEYKRYVASLDLANAKLLRLLKELQDIL